MEKVVVKKKGRIRKMVIIIVSIVLTVITALVVTISVFRLINPTKGDPEHIDNNSEYMTTYRQSFYDKNGDKFIFNGVNLGNWFVQENWMALSRVEGEMVRYSKYTQTRGMEAFRNNPNLTLEQVEELEKLYIDTYIQEKDFAIISSLGLNSVRINFTCYNLTKDGYEIEEEKFAKLDWAIEMATKYGLYVILDDHGAVGSQNQDHHSGDDSQFNLYGNSKNEEATIKLWEFIANRYKDNTTVAIYDLLNEPRRAAGKFGGKKQFDFYDKLYQAIRKIDKNHIIMMECFTFPIHGAKPQGYHWENVAYSYHIYNLTNLTISTAINFYRTLHNFLGYKVPIVIGEYSNWSVRKDWEKSLDIYDELGWSRLVWTYKANKYYYSRDKLKINLWGFYECDVEPVDVGNATYNEIKDTYLKGDTDLCEKTMIYDVFNDRNQNK